MSSSPAVAIKRTGSLAAALGLALAVALPTSTIAKPTRENVMRAQPSPAERAEINSMDREGLTGMLWANSNLQEFEIAGCYFTYLTPSKKVRVEIKLPAVLDDKLEIQLNIFQGTLTYYPMTYRGMNMISVDSGKPFPGKVDEGHSYPEWIPFIIKDNDPKKFWKVKLAFESLAKKVSAEC